eukprot:4680983-Pleurochrysis_carterae.AAC.1
MRTTANRVVRDGSTDWGHGRRRAAGAHRAWPCVVVWRESRIKKTIPYQNIENKPGDLKWDLRKGDSK